MTHTKTHSFVRFPLSRQIIHIRKMKNNAFMVTEGHAETIIVKFCNALSNKFGGLLSKIIHSTGMPTHIIIRKNAVFHTFIKDSCSGGLLL